LSETNDTVSDRFVFPLGLKFLIFSPMDKVPWALSRPTPTCLVPYTVSRQRRHDIDGPMFAVMDHTKYQMRSLQPCELSRLIYQVLPVPQGIESISQENCLKTFF
jgi:hypothetical protein